MGRILPSPPNLGADDSEAHVFGAVTEVMEERIVTYILKAIHSPTNAPIPLSSKDE
jgi:hypothetical protein